jgi:hypothetical protein
MPGMLHEPRTWPMRARAAPQGHLAECDCRVGMHTFGERLCCRVALLSRACRGITHAADGRSVLRRDLSVHHRCRSGSGSVQLNKSSVDAHAAARREPKRSHGQSVRRAHRATPDGRRPDRRGAARTQQRTMRVVPCSSGTPWNRMPESTGRDERVDDCGVASITRSAPKQPSPGADVAAGEPSPGADVGRGEPSPGQMWPDLASMTRSPPERRC